MGEREQIAADALAAIKNIVRRAIMTLLTLRDPDHRYQRQYHGSAWLFPVVNTAQESYGYARYGFEPTPHDISQMEIVAGWLAWLKRTEGEGAIRRIISWTLGVPTWRIGSRERCSERTIRNRIDRSIVAIIRQFAAVDLAVEEVEEQPPTASRNGKALQPLRPYDLVFDKSEGPHGGAVVLKKVYVYDAGFVTGIPNTRRWRTNRDGMHKAEKLLT